MKTAIKKTFALIFSDYTILLLLTYNGIGMGLIGRNDTAFAFIICLAVLGSKVSLDNRHKDLVLALEAHLNILDKFVRKIEETTKK